MSNCIVQDYLRKKSAYILQNNLCWNPPQRGEPPESSRQTQEHRKQKKKARTHNLTRFGNLPTSSGQKRGEILFK